MNEPVNEAEPSAAEKVAATLAGLETQLADATAERSELIDRQGRLAMRMHSGDSAAGEAYRGVVGERRRLDETVESLTLAVQAARAEHEQAVSDDMAAAEANRAERIDALLDLRNAALADAERALREALDRLDRAGELAAEIVEVRGAVKNLPRFSNTLHPENTRDRLSCSANAFGLGRWLNLDQERMPFIRDDTPSSLVDVEAPVQDRYRLTEKEHAA